MTNYLFFTFLAGRSGKDVRDLMRSHDVNITVPPSDEHSNTIVVSTRALYLPHFMACEAVIFRN